MKMSKKELEKLPEFFKNISFQRRTAVRESLDLIGKSKLNLDKSLKKNIGYEDISLFTLLEEGKLNKKTREELISLGKKIHSMITCCKLSDESIYVTDIMNGYYSEIIMKCKTKDNTPATISVNGYNGFYSTTVDMTKVYEEYDGFRIKDSSEYDFYIDKINDVTFIESKHIKSEKTSKNKTCNFKSNPINTTCRNYRYILTDDDKILITNITTGRLGFAEEEVFSYVKNLQLPVDIFSYLKDIGEKFVLKGSYISIMQNYNGETKDSIEVMGGSNSLKYLKKTNSSDTKKSCLIIDDIDVFDYKVNIKEGYNKLKYTVRKNKTQGMIVNLESQGEDTLDKISGSDIKEEATTAYQKTLKKLPSWVKIN